MGNNEGRFKLFFRLVVSMKGSWIRLNSNIYVFKLIDKLFFFENICFLLCCCCCEFIF